MGVGRPVLPARPSAAQGEGMGARAPDRPKVWAGRDTAARGVRAAQGEAMAACGERLRVMGGEEEGNNRS